MNFQKSYNLFYAFSRSVSHPGGIKDSHPPNTTKTGDKRRFNGPPGSARKGFSLVAFGLSTLFLNLNIYIFLFFRVFCVFFVVLYYFVQNRSSITTRINNYKHKFTIRWKFYILSFSVRQLRGVSILLDIAPFGFVNLLFFLNKEMKNLWRQKF